jgi:HK97 family phage portal protein
LVPQTTPMTFSKSELTSLHLEAPEKRSGPFGDPTTPLTAVAVWNEMDGGGTAAGEMISERTALAISTVYTCVTLIAEAVASLPCKLMRTLPNGKEEATDQPLYNLLAFAPNDDMTAFTFWSTMVGCSALTGNGYAYISRDPDGTPNGFWPLHPLKTSPMRLPDGTLAFKTTDGQGDSVPARILSAKDVLHFPLFSLDGIMGKGPVTSARETYALAKAAEKFGSKWFGNGAQASSVYVLKGAKPDPKVQTELKESWQSSHGGANQNKTAFLFGDWDVKTVGMSPEDSQFLATRSFQRAEIAAMFHLAPHQVGDTSRLSNSNYVSAQLSFITDTLRPILCRIEAELKRKLVGTKSNLGWGFDLSERLRGDFASQMASYAMSKQWGLLTTNEIRKQMGYNPVGPEGDVLWSPVNMQNSDLMLMTQSIQDAPLPDAADPVDPVDPAPEPEPATKKKAKK